MQLFDTSKKKMQTELSKSKRLTSPFPWSRSNALSRDKETIASVVSVATVLHTRVTETEVTEETGQRTRSLRSNVTND